MKHLKAGLSACVALCMLALVLVGCGNGNTSNSPVQGSSQSEAGQGSTPGSVAPASQPVQTGGKGYYFVYEGTEIVMGENMAGTLEALGEPLNVFEAPSCAFEGIDRIYYYPGFEISTYPQGDEDFILSLTLADDSVTTPEGVYLGMTAEEVEAEYGVSTSDNANLLSYKKDGTELAFVLESGVVVDITYYYQM